MSLEAEKIVRQDCIRSSYDVSRLEPLRGEHILITGGTGFMGLWLSEMITYLNDQYDYRIKISLLSRRGAEKLQNVAPHLLNRSDISFIQQDVKNLISLPEDVNWIIHAAGNPDNREHASDPLQVMRVVANGTASVLEAATRLPNLKMLLNISSGLIYGQQPLNLEKIPESYIGGPDCASIKSAYVEAKRFGETLCATYRNQHRLAIINVRPFAFIGPYQLLDRPWAINNFINEGLRGGPIRIQGNGETVRSYLYGSDMAWWLLNILVQGTISNNYNVGSDEGITLFQLAQKIAGNFPIHPEILIGVGSAKKNISSRFVPNVIQVQNSLRLKITVDLDTAIEQTIKWNQLNTLIK